MTKEIQLTQGKIALVDDDIYDYINQWKWHAHLVRGKWYVERTDRKGNHYKMHRLIVGAKNNESVDHVNGDSLDNRRANLRLCSITENNRNAKTRIDNTSGFKGVWKRAKKFVSYIKVNKERIYLGTFDNAVDAAKAYDNAALKHHGDFAHTNAQEGKL